MKFGLTPLPEALGAIAVHSVRTRDSLVRKGAVISREDLVALHAAGVFEIMTARLEPGDVGEDEAATALANAIAGGEIEVEAAFTGRSNLRAARPGIVAVDRGGVDRLNAVHEAVTFATRFPFQPVLAGEVVGTIKIIPFAIHEDVLRKALAAAGPAIAVAPYMVKSVALISTRLPGLSEKVIDKTVRVTEARLQPAGAVICSEQRVAHAPDAIAKCIDTAIGGGAELVIVLGATAIADRRDIVPSALTEAGGEIEHFGVPVDPGNLMLIGRVKGVPVIGAPGCARSAKPSGFDRVLARLLTALPITREDVTTLGVGGLLLEAGARPQEQENLALRIAGQKGA
jgi:molybdenum cofactor cytidylyltransferase